MPETRISECQKCKGSYSRPEDCYCRLEQGSPSEDLADTTPELSLQLALLAESPYSQHLTAVAEDRRVIQSLATERAGKMLERAG